MKKSTKLLAVLSATAIATPVAVVAPAASSVFAAGAGTITAVTVPTISTEATTDQALGKIKVSVAAGSLKAGNVVTVKLPSGVKLPDNSVAPQSVQSGGSSASVGGKTYKNFVSVPTIINNAGDKNGFVGTNDPTGTPDQNISPNAASNISPYTGIFSVKQLGDDRLQITVRQDLLYGGNTGADASLNGKAVSSVQPFDAVFYVELYGVDVTGASGGPLDVVFDASPNSGFPNGKVTAAKISNSGTVSVAVADTQSSNDKFQVKIDLAEDVAGAFRNGDTVKFKLPSGYKWSSTGNKASVLYGDSGVVDGTIIDPNTNKVTANALTIVPNDQELRVSYNETAAGTRSQATQIELVLNFYVDDSNTAKYGDITATVSGQSDTDVSNIVVGRYGDYNATVTAATPTNVISGQDEQDIADITIQEGIPGALVSGRTVELTLPEGARWQPEFKADTDGLSSTDPASASTDATTTSENGLHLTFTGYKGTNYRTAKFTVTGDSSNSKDPGKVTIKNQQIAVDPTFTGDVKVEVGGSASVTGEVVVAKAAGSIKASSSATPKVNIGAAGQTAGDFTITEQIAGGFSKDSKHDNNQVILDLPDGVAFDGKPTIQVTSGDLTIDNIQTAADNGTSDNRVTFEVTGESTTPSTIKVSNIKLKVDRTVAEGPITLKVKGQPVAYTSKYSDWTNDTTAAKADIATVATPAASDQRGNAVFKIGATSYTVNGSEQTMDAAPYIKNDRTYLPIRYVAQALGVSSSNILWSDADRSVTIFQNNRVVKMTIDSNVMYVNGVAVTIDAAPEINNGRTMLPIRAVGQALVQTYSGMQQLKL